MMSAHARPESWFKQAVECDSQGKYGEALKLYRKSIIVGDHPNAAMVYNSMAMNYKSQRKYKKALELLRKSLAISIEEYGPNHPVSPKNQTLNLQPSTRNPLS